MSWAEKSDRHGCTSVEDWPSVTVHHSACDQEKELFHHHSVQLDGLANILASNEGCYIHE